jgi:hypothetical protein
MFNPDPWPLPLPALELTDQAAAQIAEFLMDLALWFESMHFSQIRRHHQEMQPQPAFDPNQLQLFESFDPF